MSKPSTDWMMTPIEGRPLPNNIAFSTWGHWQIILSMFTINMDVILFWRANFSYQFPLDSPSLLSSAWFDHLTDQQQRSNQVLLCAPGKGRLYHNLGSLCTLHYIQVIDDWRWTDSILKWKVMVRKLKTLTITINENSPSSLRTKLTSAMEGQK